MHVITATGSNPLKLKFPEMIGKMLCGIVSRASFSRKGFFSTLSTWQSQQKYPPQLEDRVQGRHLEAVPLAFVSFEDKSEASKQVKKKTPLIIQHAVLGSKDNWKTVSKEIHHTTKRTVFTVDARNHGDSPHTKVMTFTSMVKDIELFVRHINANKISFMGHSFGGRIGLMLAFTRPELIDKLIVVDSSPFVNKKSFQRWWKLREACALLKQMESQLKECSGLTRKTLADKTIEDVLVDKRDRAVFLSNLITVDEAQKNGTKRLWRVNLDAILENPKLMAQYPDSMDISHEGPLRKYHGEVLFINGDKSQFIQRDDETSILALFPKAKFVWLPDAGHWIHVEKHEEFMSTIVPYLEDQC